MRKLQRRSIWTITVGAGASVVVALLVLVGVGVLILPDTSSSSPVSVTAVQVTILQGTLANGQGWFGSSPYTLTGAANGYPYHVSPGASFSITLVLTNNDSLPHTVYSVSVSPPFTFAGTNPTLPATLAPFQDTAPLTVVVGAPSSPGTTSTLLLTINALYGG
ncbi:MAG: hypothetical protein ACRECR_01900 [Thermoplasmata archaeon]